MSDVRIVAMQTPEEQGAIREGGNFARPFKEVVGSFLVSLVNAGLLRVDREEIGKLLSDHFRDVELLQVVDLSSDRKKPKPTVEIDPETGKRRLEFAEANTKLANLIDRHAETHGGDYGESYAAVLNDPKNADLVAAWDEGPAPANPGDAEVPLDPSPPEAFDAGANLDVLAKEIQQREGRDYESAFTQACEENPEWASAYANS